MALIFEDYYPNLDIKKLIKLCIVHDLGEAINGDIPAVDQAPDVHKGVEERKDLMELIAPLPKAIKEKILDLWDEYENISSEEAVVAKALDKLETLIQHTQGKNPEDFNSNLLSPKAMQRYYEYYFFKRSNEMVYRVKAKDIGQDDNLLNMLSVNSLAVQAYQRASKHAPDIPLWQSFKSAANAFKVIDAPTEGIVVPYDDEGKQIIAGKRQYVSKKFKDWLDGLLKGAIPYAYEKELARFLMKVSLEV